ncbi:MAG: alpha/beta hydrolase [Halioglobus sp.]
MAHWDQESLEALRQSLQPLGSGTEPSVALRDFCRHYQIDFGERLPDVSHRIGAVQSGDFSLAVHCYEVVGASRNLLLVHGYTDHVGLFRHLIEYGLQQGCNVVAFDLPGHGLSTGDFVVIDDFSDYSQAIVNVMAAAQMPEIPWWTMAQSTGCAALIDYAGKYPWTFYAAVFLAPLIRPVGWGRIRVGHALLRRFRDSIGRKFAANSGDAAFLEFLKSDPLQSRRISIRWVGALRRWLSGLEFKDLGVGPVLVLQGDADGTVAWRYNMKKLVKLFPGTDIEYLPGAGHHLANETAEIRRLYLGKVGRFLDFPPPADEG